MIANFLPLGFLVALAWALAWPQPGREVASWKVRLQIPRGNMMEVKEEE